MDTGQPVLKTTNQPLLVDTDNHGDDDDTEDDDAEDDDGDGVVVLGLAPVHCNLSRCQFCGKTNFFWDSKSEMPNIYDAGIFASLWKRL